MRRAAERGRAVLVRSKLPHHAKKATALVALHARRAHGATLGKAHGHLTNKVPAYRKWHGWKHHKHVHHGVLATVLVAATLNIVLYRSAFALSDITQLWNFSSQSDYTLSDANALEYNGNSVRLKTQNYTNDASTMALYHLDESNGTSATDSSSNANAGTLANSPTWGTGNLNNALALNGTNQSVSAADSSSLSLSQSSTLEAWTKLGSSFSANSQQNDQVVLDKGSYKLYYDHETGKPTYELENSSATSWTPQAGNGQNNSWNTYGPSAARASVVHNSKLYVGVGGSTGYAQVWEYTGSVWTKVGGEGVNSSWAANTYEDVYALTTDGTYLYAGLGTTAGDAEVWRYNGSSWTKIGGDGINSSWAAATYETVSGLSSYGGSVYAGLGNTSGDGEVWQWNGSSWTKIGGDGVNSSWSSATIVGVVSMANDGSNLYVGTSGNAGDGDVWKWNGSVWSQLGGDGLSSSWAASTYEQVPALFYQAGSLYAGTGTSSGDAEVWKWNGSAWSRLAYSGSTFAAATYEAVYSITGDGTNIYVGTGNSQNDGDVYKYTGSAWSQIGGDGLSSGWTQGYYVLTLNWFNGKLYADSTQASSGDVFYSWNGSAWTREAGMFYAGTWGMININGVRSMTTANGKLYAGLAGNSNASVFEYTGSTWRIIGAPGLNSAWGVSQIAEINTMTSMGGQLYIGTSGGQNGDAEVWRWNGTSWSQVGGDGINSSWSGVTRTTSMISDGTYLYAGIGSASSAIGEVWRYNGTSWTRIGGGGVNSGWNATHRMIYSMALYRGELYIGGYSAAVAAGDLWKWNGSSWTQIGGDGLNSGWNFTSTTNGEVGALAVYGDKLYAGVGAAAGDASLWSWDGASWTKVGGDDVNGSWATSTYERVGSMVVYNGQLYAGLGSTGSNGELWRYNGSTWVQVGGDSLNGSWSSSIESVRSLAVYKGKLFAGLGDTQNSDALIYSYGNNGFLQGSTSSFDTSWRHLAATYDGATMKLYINGVLDASVSTSLSIPDLSTKLYIGQSQGSQGSSTNHTFFNGSLDEIRISNTARTSFTTAPYTSSRVGVRLNSAVHTDGVATWDGLASNYSADGGSVLFRLSIDGGTTWKYWNSSAWADSSGLEQASSISDVNTNIASIGVTSGGVVWQAVLQGNGTQRPSISSVTLTATADTTPPGQNADNVIMKSAPSGSTVAESAWTNAATPYFSWDAAIDTQSAITAYCLYLGQSGSDDPQTSKGILGTSPLDLSGTCPFAVSAQEVDLSANGILASALVSSSNPYYLKIKAVDNAGNIVADSKQFAFRYDGTAPTNPLFVSTPSQFVANKAVTVTWPTVGGDAALDNHSGVVGLQYRIGANGTWYGDNHSGAQDSTDVLANDGSYQTIDPTDFDALQDGNNTIYFRTWDAAGNVSNAYVTGVIKINTSSPSVPQNLEATPASNTVNSFAFSWLAPASYGGSESNLTYCYTINTLPSVNTCSFTPAGTTVLAAGAYATQPGQNTMYVVAKDESGNINYATYASTTFTANTSAPGVPLNADIADISVKATSNWKLAISWEQPTDVGAGVAQYRVLRSQDDISYAQVATTSGTSYVDTSLSPIRYYYKVKACDSANNCGATTLQVNEKPTGKFTSAAGLVAEPSVSDISTRRVTISWSTDRDSDSRIQFGKSSGNYFSTEVASSEQTTDHGITINNLSSGTTYFARARWTDEDGNIGTSDEFSFSTSPAPTIKEVTNKQVGLSSATIQFTSKEASKVKILYGKSESFGGSQIVNTSLQESTYSAVLPSLEDGTKYYYKINTYDSEDNEYEGNVYSLTTPARPRISNLRFEQVEGEPTSTQRVTWSTNVPATSEVAYSTPGQASREELDSQKTTEHAIVIRGLLDDSIYSLVARSYDGQGNVAVSDTQTFRTALDTRPPRISNVIVKSVIRGTGSDARGQVIVSWQTDEPSTSQVAFSQGTTGGELSSRTAEDAKLVTDHLVIVSDLTPSKVYQVQALSKDRSSNQAKSLDQTTIVGKAPASVFDIVFKTLQSIFSFIK